MGPRLLCILLATGLIWLATRTPVQAQPNILWITVEDMSPTLGYLGDTYATTPNLDALAAESVQFSQVFAASPVCAPSRSTLINGVLSTTLGTQRLRSLFPQPEYMNGFPELMREAGYYTTNNWKTDYNTGHEDQIRAKSWDEVSQTAHWRGKKPDQPFFAIFNDMTTHQSRTMSMSYETFQKNVQSQLSEDEIHHPALAPIPPYYPDTPVIRKTIARYYDAVTVMDKNVGKLLAQLEEDGLADDTIVFFYSDHGSGLPRHKRLLHDSGMHIPMLIRFPDKYKHLAPAPDGSTVDRLISFLDFAPTALSLVGVEIPDYMQGTSFLGPDAGPEPEYLFATRDRIDEAWELARSVRDKRWVYIRNYMPHVSYNQPSVYSDFSEIRPEITRLAAAGDLKSEAQAAYAGARRPVEELYDRWADPWQIRNLAGSEGYASVLAKMRERLSASIKETNDLGFMPEHEAWTFCASGVPFDCRADPDVHPQDRLVAAASLVGMDEKVDEAVALLGDGHAGVRYWAAVALRAQETLSPEILSALEAALQDESRTVRIEASGAMLAHQKSPAAVEVLLDELGGETPETVLHAARTLELLGDRVAGAKDVMRSILPEWKGFERGPLSLFVQFSLQAALEKMGVEVPAEELTMPAAG